MDKYNKMLSTKHLKEEVIEKSQVTMIRRKQVNKFSSNHTAKRAVIPAKYDYDDSSLIFDMQASQSGSAQTRREDSIRRVAEKLEKPEQNSIADLSCNNSVNINIIQGVEEGNNEDISKPTPIESEDLLENKESAVPQIVGIDLSKYAKDLIDYMNEERELELKKNELANGTLTVSDMFAEEDESNDDIQNPKNKLLILPCIDASEDNYGYYIPKLNEIFNGRYQITQIIGKGVFSCVAQAFDSVDSVDVAVKILKNHELMRLSGEKERQVLSKLNKSDPNSTIIVY